MAVLTRKQAAALQQSLGHDAETARRIAVEREREAIITARRPEEYGLMTSGVPSPECEAILLAARHEKKQKPKPAPKPEKEEIKRVFL